MELNEEDAAAMYARACRSWYGQRALKVVKQQIRHLKHNGDPRGVEAWSRVADKLAHMKQGPALEHGKLY